ncbi:hypothetical protein HPB48_002613 [Haemaphysalis longicornis]|uniref:Uncharacterized protein n=1 Tax=Haemaphysalis longicornis TaxID=44386 RepID=A0A9J6G2Q0_HAELO|nr:hypothetical protein HPB48_002613 [Haemaphysalis longicornis]
MATPRGECVRNAEPVPCGQPPLACAADGGGTRAVPYGDSVDKELVRATFSVSAAQSKPNVPAGSGAHLGSHPFAPLQHKQARPPSPIGVAPDALNQRDGHPYSSHLGTPIAFGPLNSMRPNTGQAPRARGLPPPPAGTALAARSASQHGPPPLAQPSATGTPVQRRVPWPGAAPLGPPPPTLSSNLNSVSSAAVGGPGQSAPPLPFSSSHHCAAALQAPLQGQPSGCEGLRPAVGPPPIYVYSGLGRLPVPPASDSQLKCHEFATPARMPGVHQQWAGCPPHNAGVPSHALSYHPLERSSCSQQTEYGPSGSIAINQQAPQKSTLEGEQPGHEPHSHMVATSPSDSSNKILGYKAYDLLQDRPILPKNQPKQALPGESSNSSPYHVEGSRDRSDFTSREIKSCSRDIFRCTLNKIPETQYLLKQARLPLGVLIHPFREVRRLPVLQDTTIVRCLSCGAYINPYVQLMERQRWKCNICFRISPLPDDFMYDPSTKESGEPERRPEVRSATVEFITPADYMSRPPQPAAYLFVLDVSYGAIRTGYLSSFCKVLLHELDNLPGDGRTRVGFVTFDSSVHFYNLGEGLSQPQMLLVPDIDDVFLPFPDGLLVNVHESKALVRDLLTNLPSIHANNDEPTSALGAAVQAAYQLINLIGGRVSVFQTCLPNAGPGRLKPREEQKAGTEIANLLPATDFYKKIALDCSSQHVAVDVFLMGAQYMDVASLACISKYTAGSVNYYPGLHSSTNRSQVEKFEADLRYYLTRNIGFEAVMRVRCTRGLVVDTYHGNLFLRSTDLLWLPNVNPEAGFGVQIAIEDGLADCNLASIQVAVLYTSARGERRVRVHTLCLPVTAMLEDVLASVDQEAVVGMLCKMAVDRSLSSSVLDARDAMMNACLDLIQAFRATLCSSPAVLQAGLAIPYGARLLPLYVLALLKHKAFRVDVRTRLDERVFAMEQMKTMPLRNLITYIYPALHPIHELDDLDVLELDDGTLVCQPPRLQLSLEKIDRHGCYVLDTVDRLYIYVGRDISEHFCTNVLGVPNYASIPEYMTELPPLATEESEMVRNFLSWTQSRRHVYSPLRVIREDSKARHLIVQHMVDDKTGSGFSYREFLQHLKAQLSE